MSHPSPRKRFRALTQTRGGYGGSPLYDVHVQSVGSGDILQAHSFTDAKAAERYLAQLERDLDTMELPDFCRTYGLPTKE